MPCGAGAEAMAKGITANYAVFSSERIRGITFLANFQFFSLYEHKGINEFENTAPQLLLVKVFPSSTSAVVKLQIWVKYV